MPSENCRTIRIKRENVSKRQTERLMRQKAIELYVESIETDRKMKPEIIMRSNRGPEYIY